jgi:riboflavin kinase/FMN adenylyltransferase
LIASFDLNSTPPPAPAGSVVSIGVFDGVHLGHQAILQRNVALARELGARPTVVTFRRHPKRLLLGREPKTLTSLEHRLELFRRAGIEQTLALSFDEELRQLEAEEFVQQVLIERLGARAYVLGFDSKFGKDRRGGPALLAELGCDVRVVEQILVGGRAVSSTAIREAVELGDFETARRMLGRRVSVLGTVVRGEGLGRRLGFPTANLNVHHELHPPHGVYAGWAARLDGHPGDAGPPAQQQRAMATPERLPAVVNIGVRPTLGGARTDEARIEVHLLDFAGELYGREIELTFLARLRTEQRFANLDALRDQIALDAARACELLAKAVD